jgi:hypothetical protein
MRGLQLENPGTEFVFGDCPTGADALALKIVKDNCMNYKVFEADWGMFERKRPALAAMGTWCAT